MLSNENFFFLNPCSETDLVMKHYFCLLLFKKNFKSNHNLTIFVNYCFFCKILNIFYYFIKEWISKFDSAKQAMAQASEAAAEAARANLQEVYDQCTRVSLKITLKVSFPL